MADDQDVICLETTISDALTDRTSSSGTPYCALVLPNGEWVFVWDGTWKDEIEDNVDQYRDLDAEIYVTDKEDDPDDHFYNLEAVVPADESEAERFLQRSMAEDDVSTEETPSIDRREVAL